MTLYRSLVELASSEHGLFAAEEPHVHPQTALTGAFYLECGQPLQEGSVAVSDDSELYPLGVLHKRGDVCLGPHGARLYKGLHLQRDQHRVIQASVCMRETGARAVPTCTRPLFHVASEDSKQSLVEPR